LFKANAVNEEDPRRGGGSLGFIFIFRKGEYFSSYRTPLKLNW